MVGKCHVVPLGVFKLATTSIYTHLILLSIFSSIHLQQQHIHVQFGWEMALLRSTQKKADGFFTQTYCNLRMQIFVRSIGAWMVPKSGKKPAARREVKSCFLFKFSLQRNISSRHTIERKPDNNHHFNFLRFLPCARYSRASKWELRNMIVFWRNRGRIYYTTRQFL